MAESGFPNTYHTETTTTTGLGPLYLDVGVIKSKYGIIKIAEVALDLLGFICVISTIYSYSSRGSFFNSVAMGGFWSGLILLVLYVFHLPEKVPKVPWKRIECVLACIWAGLYLIAASLLANQGYIEAFAAAAFFGFSAMLIYAYDAWDCYTNFMGGTVVRSTTTTTTTVNAPSPTTY